MRNKVLEEQVEELTRTYALQFVKQKTQITEQGAQLLLTNKQENFLHSLDKQAYVTPSKLGQISASPGFGAQSVKIQNSGKRS